MSKTKFIFKPVFSWDRPIEDELLEWARYMKNSNRSYITHTIWGKREKREAEIYAMAFEMMEKRIMGEKKLRSHDHQA